MEKQIENLIAQYNDKVTLLDRDITNLQGDISRVRSHYKVVKGGCWQQDEEYIEAASELMKVQVQRQCYAQFKADLDSLLSYV
jgi:predicted double-glycine peptidase